MSGSDNEQLPIDKPQEEDKMQPRKKKNIIIIIIITTIRMAVLTRGDDPASFGTHFGQACELVVECSEKKEKKRPTGRLYKSKRKRNRSTDRRHPNDK